MPSKSNKEKLISTSVNNSKVHTTLGADCCMKFDMIAVFFSEGKGWNKFPLLQNSKALNKGFGGYAKHY